MHRSRLAGFIIDCQTADLENGLERAASFWAAALGMDNHGRDGASYVRLDGSARDLQVEVQAVSHPSRVHLDLETDDLDAEVARLERLGAKRVEKVRGFWVMEAPTGQRFCIVQTSHDLATTPDARVWE